MDPRTVPEIVAYVFIDLAVIIVLARLMGRLAVKVGQPAVVGEIIAGIMLGPSLLGLFPGDLDTLLFPADIRPYLNVLAQLGIVLFMFLVGLEVDLSFIRGREKVAVVGLAGLDRPAVRPRLPARRPICTTTHDTVNDATVSFLAFALFLGVAMSITAFPVLARILAERNMHRIPTGVLALACAAVDDVLAWSLLAIVVAIVSATSFVGVDPDPGLLDRLRDRDVRGRPPAAQEAGRPTTTASAGSRPTCWPSSWSAPAPVRSSPRRSASTSSSARSSSA